MLILILVNVQHSRKAVCSFEKGLNHQNHSSPGSLYPVKKSPPPGKISEVTYNENLPTFCGDKIFSYIWQDKPLRAELKTNGE